MDDDKADMSMSLEDIKAKHRKELKELQANIQSLKHSVPKGDKRKKKEISSEIALLEAKLEEKHKSEIERFEKSNAEESNKDDCSEDKNHEEVAAKLTRAQKRRNKKEVQEKEREQMIAAAEKENVNCPRNMELTSLKQCLDSLDLEIQEVAPDGNCLFAAIATQLGSTSTSYRVEELRKIAADFMMANADDFLPFLVDPKTGEGYTESEFQRYCVGIEGSNAWGGQAEIKAISQTLQIPIEIYQSDAPVIKIGEEFDKDPVRLSYHRHIYGLGEHYNAVTKVSTSDTKEE